MADQAPTDGQPAPVTTPTITPTPASPPVPPVVAHPPAQPAPTTPPAPAAKTYTQQEWDAEQGRLAAKWESEKLAPVRAQLDDLNKRLDSVKGLVSDNDRLAALAVPEKFRPIFARLPASERAAAIEDAHKSGLFAAEPPAPPAPPKPAGSGAPSSPPATTTPAPTPAPNLFSAPGIFDAKKLVEFHRAKKAV